jgi:hypothetical protein
VPQVGIISTLGGRAAGNCDAEGVGERYGSMLSHAIWESQRDFDTFADSRLKPAFEAVGGLPMPSVTTFVVHNSYST